MGRQGNGQATMQGNGHGTKQGNAFERRQAAIKDKGGCKVEAVVSVDERGQMVLPKDVRERAGILPGDKFALMSWEKEGQVCCLTLIKVEDLAEMAKVFLGPMIQDIA